MARCKYHPDVRRVYCHACQPPLLALAPEAPRVYPTRYFGFEECTIAALEAQTGRPLTEEELAALHEFVRRNGWHDVTG